MSATATQVTQLTAPNHTIEGPHGVSYAYRRLGEPSASAPGTRSSSNTRPNSPASRAIPERQAG